MDLKLEEMKEEVLEMLKSDSGIKARQIRRLIENTDTSMLKSKRERLRFEQLMAKVKKFYTLQDNSAASFLGPVLF